MATEHCWWCEGWGCSRCEPPYAASRGIDGPTPEELELERLRAFRTQHQAEIDRLRTELLRLAAPVCCPNCGTEVERSAA